MKSFLFYLYFFFSLSICQAEAASIPDLRQRVTDTAQVLTAEQRSHIEQLLTDLEQTKGSQVAVLIVPTTQPESIEGYSIRVVEKWKLGRKDIDDGVLLLIAHSDRKVRIEVGYGLEGAITDLSASRIIKEYITPEFKRGNFYKGILDGVGQISNLINGEPLPAAAGYQEQADDGDIFFLVLFSSFFLVGLLKSVFGRIVSAILITSIGTALVWFFSYNAIMTLLAFFLLGMISLFFSSKKSNYRNGSGHGGGFGGGSGGFGGGGGFSGGGGGFGGGGSSGGW